MFVKRPLHRRQSRTKAQPGESNVCEGRSQDHHIALRGNNFVRKSRAQWNGRYRQTQYLTPTMMNAKVLASDLVKAGKATLTVVSPGPGGGESDAATFAVVK
jgi:hypothetical protein